MVKHSFGRSLFALVFGLGMAWLAYSWITDPAPRAKRAAEEQAVLASRVHLADVVGDGEIEIVDPLAPNRKVGKVYVYAEDPGWAISGHYRRGKDDRWHAYLMHLTADLELHAVKAEDRALEVR